MDEAGPLVRAEGVTVTKATRSSDPPGPTVAGLICAVNIAFDPQGRLSAHAIFSHVQASAFPFRFQQPFYVVATVHGLSGGEHKLALRPEAGILEFALEEHDEPITAENGLAIVVFAVVHCVAHQAGQQYLTVAVDGKFLEPAFAFRVDREEADESTQ